MSSGFSGNPVVLVSTDGGGDQANNASLDPAVSDDNCYVAFQSFASDLVRGDDNRTSDVFVKDLWTGVVALASADAEGEPRQQ